jgi:hypothetical protein
MQVGEETHVVERGAVRWRGWIEQRECKMATVSRVDIFHLFHTDGVNTRDLSGLGERLSRRHPEAVPRNDAA